MSFLDLGVIYVVSPPKWILSSRKITIKIGKVEPGKLKKTRNQPGRQTCLFSSSCNLCGITTKTSSFQKKKNYQNWKVKIVQKTASQTNMPILDLGIIYVGSPPKLILSSKKIKERTIKIRKVEPGKIKKTRKQPSGRQTCHFLIMM